jgi:Leucine-rich repeat (LRR) protein
LREASNYLIEFATRLPNFHAAATRELLQRDGAIIELLSNAIEMLPPPVTPREWGSGGDDSRFESAYLRQLQRQLDNLELFGLDLARAYRRYQLSVAYISLSMSKPEKSSDASGVTPLQDKSNTKETGELLRAEKALSTTDRVVIRGWAGSGKTTLLQWIAVSAARNNLPDVMDAWRGKVPFFIQLRRWVHHEWPGPEQFLHHAAPTIEGGMPPGYVHRVLASGRGLILVDGVDEVPDDERDAARRWLEQLVETFPDCKYVLTSRPPALTEVWRSLPGFATSEIQPMELADVRSFITHWHEAALGPQPSTDLRSELATLSDKLQTRVRDSNSLKSLATSPLLCAMICALHRTRRTRLPENRMELYRVAIEVLLTRRDPEREVIDSSVGDLLQSEQEALLQEIALWILHNGQSDAEKYVAVNLIELKLPHLTGIKASPEEVYTYLLTRSGLLREPTIDRVDFLHRTFLEYFAAKLLIAREEVPQLVSRAHEDQWREVVILACGHATVSQREKLLNGLLERASSEGAHAHALQLLAVTCLETSTELPPDLRDELENRLTSLLPPKNLTEATALASAGDLAAKHLGYQQRPALIQAACVRTLVRVGSPEALKMLKRYASDRRVTVTRELVKGWGYYDPETYADEILSLSHLDNGAIQIRDSSLLPYVGKLTNLQFLTCELSGRVTTLDAFSDLPPVLLGLDVSDCRAVNDLEPLRNQGSLKSLDITRTGVVDLSPLRDIELRTFRAMRTSVSHLDDLRGSQLQHVAIDDTPISDLEPLRPSASQLETLWLDETGVTSLAPLEGGERLRFLTCTDTPIEDFSPLSTCSSLVMLWCGGSPDGALATLPRSHSITELMIRRGSCQGIDSVGQLVNLRNLDLTMMRDMEGLDFLAGLKRLERLRLANDEGSVSLAPLANLPSLTQVTVMGDFYCDEAALANSPKLESYNKQQSSPLSDDALRAFNEAGFSGRSVSGYTRLSRRPLGTSDRRSAADRGNVPGQLG